VQNLEEKERKLHQTRSNFRTGNSANICRNAAAIAFRLGGRITTGTPYRPQNVYQNGVPVRSGTTTPLEGAVDEKVIKNVYRTAIYYLHMYTERAAY